MRPQHDGLPVPRGLQHPDLLLLERLPVGVGLEPEGLGAEVLVLAVDEADGPAPFAVGGGGVAVAAGTAVGAVGPVEPGHGGDWKRESGFSLHTSGKSNSKRDNNLN